MFILSILLLPLVNYAQVKVFSGKVERIENFPSKFVKPRNIDIWLPQDFDTQKKYAVLYMHDGQMLFDSTATWNHKEWKVDEVISPIKNELKDCIVVGIWNTGDDRISEYMPTKIYNRLPDSVAVNFSKKYANNKGAQGDKYLNFLTQELKPYIDQKYPTLKNRENTMIMGSSMGALISLYAICEYPETFGGVACMSTAWLNFIDNHFALATLSYLNEKIPNSQPPKIYMDYGTGESDAGYIAMQNFVDYMFQSKAFTEKNYRSKVFDKDIHDENAWSKRLDIPLKFLLSKTERAIPSAGKIDFFENFPSKYVTSRNVDVWLPSNYDARQKYAVLYMHDGQMLFDSTTTWNKQEWGVDEHLAALQNDTLYKPTIVVGIWNGGKTRHSDYFPQKPFESLPKSYQDSLFQIKGIDDYLFVHKIQSDNYLKFIVTELKPFIDTHYSTYGDLDNTFIAGSSMGGLISYYAICEYNNIFGGAACLSTHWPGVFKTNDDRIPKSFVSYLEYFAPCSKNHKIYFDYGTETLDTSYEPYQLMIDAAMEEAGFEKNKSFKSLKFEGADHSENAWKSRLDIPLKFLLKK